jgi:predicted ester cyclase
MISQLQIIFYVLVIISFLGHKLYRGDTMSNIQTIELLYKNMINARNFAAVPDYFHPDYHMTYSSDVPGGIESVSGALDPYFKASSDLSFSLVETIEEVNTVAVIWFAEGTHDGPLNGIEPTNRKVSLYGASFYRLQDGKVIQGSMFKNDAAILAQIVS